MIDQSFCKLLESTAGHRRHNRSQRRSEFITDEKARQNFSNTIGYIFVDSVAGLRKDLHLELPLHLRNV